MLQKIIGSMVICSYLGPLGRTAATALQQAWSYVHFTVGGARGGVILYHNDISGKWKRLHSVAGEPEQSEYIRLGLENFPLKF